MAKTRWVTLRLTFSTSFFDEMKVRQELLRMKVIDNRQGSINRSEGEFISFLRLPPGLATDVSAQMQALNGANAEVVNQAKGTEKKKKKH